MSASRETNTVLPEMAISDLSKNLRADYDVVEVNHATAILFSDFPAEWDDIDSVLRTFRLHRSHIEAPGGGLSPIASGLADAFEARGWETRDFNVSVNVNDDVRDTRSHKVDMFKPGAQGGGVAIEVEWNNKDEFFDRDLNNFRLLQSLGAISVGVVVTRSTSLRMVFDKFPTEIRREYGNTSTHMEQLLKRLNGGAAGGCPVLAFGIRPSLFEADK